MTFFDDGGVKGDFVDGGGLVGGVLRVDGGAVGYLFGGGGLGGKFVVADEVGLAEGVPEVKVGVLVHGVEVTADGASE